MSSNFKTLRTFYLFRALMLISCLHGGSSLASTRVTPSPSSFQQKFEKFVTICDRFNKYTDGIRVIVAGGICTILLADFLYLKYHTRKIQQQPIRRKKMRKIVKEKIGAEINEAMGNKATAQDILDTNVVSIIMDYTAPSVQQQTVLDEAEEQQEKVELEEYTKLVQERRSLLGEIFSILVNRY